MDKDQSNGLPPAVDEKKLRRDIALVDARFWPKFRRVAARLPFSEDLLASYYCARDPRTPTYVKAALFGALAYFVMPADMVPDFIAGLGFTDDATVLLAAVSAFRQRILPDHHKRAKYELGLPDDDKTEDKSGTTAVG